MLDDDVDPVCSAVPGPGPRGRGRGRAEAGGGGEAGGHVRGCGGPGHLQLLRRHGARPLRGPRQQGQNLRIPNQQQFTFPNFP